MSEKSVRNLETWADHFVKIKEQKPGEFGYFPFEFLGWDMDNKAVGMVFFDIPEDSIRGVWKASTKIALDNHIKDFILAVDYPAVETLLDTSFVFVSRVELIGKRPTPIRYSSLALPYSRKGELLPRIREGRVIDLMQRQSAGLFEAAFKYFMLKKMQSK